MKAKLSKYLFLAPLAVVSLVACSSAAPKSEIKKNQHIESFSSSRNLPATNSQSCPATDKVWRQEQTKQLLAHANKCALVGQWAQVEALGDHIAKKDIESPWGAYYLSLAAHGRKEYPRALWMIDLALRKNPDVAEFVYQRGRIQWDAGSVDLAVKSFEKSIQMNPKLTDAHLFLAQIYYRDQDLKAAMERYQSVLSAEPENTLALTGLSEVQLKTGNKNEALVLLERAVDASPGNVAYRLRLGSVYESVVKDPQKALVVYRKLQTLITDNRGLKSEVSFDLSKKISSLEAQVAKILAGKKMTLKNTDESGGVKK